MMLQTMPAMTMICMNASLLKTRMANMNVLNRQGNSQGINRINSLHARLKDFMHGFKGVSTKYLQSYLAWFQWTEAFKSGPTEQRGVIGRQIRNGVYRLTRSMYVRMPMPV